MALIATGMLFATACGQGDDADVAAGRDSEAPATEPASASRRPAQETTTTTAPSTTTTSTTEADEQAPPTTPPAEGPCGGATETAAPAGPEAAPASLESQGIQGVRARPADAPPECSGPGPDPEPELGTGDVQVTLRWESSADLDLHVIEPDGTEIWYQAPGPSSTGGQLDVDSNVGCEQEASVENIFWPTGDAPSGRYTIEVTGYQVDDCGSGSYSVTGMVQGEQVLMEGGSVGEDETDTFHIDV
jgi:hypothetical protein